MVRPPPLSCKTVFLKPFLKVSVGAYHRTPLDPPDPPLPKCCIRPCLPFGIEVGTFIDVFDCHQSAVMIVGTFRFSVRPRLVRGVVVETPVFVGSLCNREVMVWGENFVVLWWL